MLHPDDNEVKTGTGFRFGSTKGNKIDYVFVTPEFEVLTAEIVRDSRDRRYPSDHFPVTARLQLKTE